MNISHVEAEKGFSVIGIVTRTTNETAIGDGTIKNLWQEFFNESILSKIPNKVDNAIVAVYYDFESDKSGEYTLLIGAKVSSIEEIPAGMTAHYIPEQKRIIFLSEPGPINNIVFDLWMKIWTLEDQNKLDRQYNTDYELYDDKCQDPQKSQITIHIGVK